MTPLEALEGLGARGLLEQIADEYGTSPQVLLGRGRRQRVANARTRFYYVLWSTLGLSFPELGELLDRDHTTILMGVRKEERLARERLGI